MSKSKKDIALERVLALEKELLTLKKIISEPEESMDSVVLQNILGINSPIPRIYFTSDTLVIQADKFLSLNKYKKTDKLLKKYSPSDIRLEGLLLLNKLANIAQYVNGKVDVELMSKEAYPRGYVIRHVRRDSKLVIEEQSYTVQGNILFKKISAALEAIEIMGKEDVIKALKTFE